MKKPEERKNWFLKFLFVPFLFLSTPLLAIPVTVDGDIIGDFKYLDLTITMSQITSDYFPGGQPPTDAASLFAGYLNVYLPVSDRDRPIVLEANKGDKTTNWNNKYYWSGIDATSDIGSDGNFVLTFHVFVYANDLVTPISAISDLKNTDDPTTVTVVAEFLKPSTTGGGFTSVTRSEDTLIKQLFAKPNEAPRGISVRPEHLALLFNWTPGWTTRYTNPSINRVPGAVFIMVFDPDAGKTHLNAHVVDNQAGNDTVTDCYYQPGGADCIQCDVANGVYIDDEQDSTDQAVFHVANNTGGYLVSNLDPKKTYTVVMQYETGVVRSTCQEVRPTENVTLTELNGAKSELGDPRCFIVSATYGSAFSEHVSIFRWFRGAVLMQFELGKLFVRNYYKMSPPLAKVIKDSPFLQKSFQLILFTPAILLYSCRFMIEHLWLALASMGSFMLMLVLVLRLQRRRV